MKLPRWTLPGVITDKRELKTKKDDSVWAYSIKIAAIGGTYEVKTRAKALYDKMGVGEEITCTGTFEQYGGNLQLALTDLIDPAAAPKIQPAAKSA